MASDPSMKWRVGAIAACVVGLPLAAVFGTSLPEMVRRVLPATNQLAFSTAAHAGAAEQEPLPYRVVFQREPFKEAANCAASPPVAPRPTPRSDPFETLQRRLAEVGAVDCRLEPWGDDRRLYRFQCSVALDSAPEICRYFEAAEEDAAAAMSRVLEEVAAWQADQAGGRACQTENTP